MSPPTGLPFALAAQVGSGAFCEVFRLAAKPAVAKIARLERLNDRFATGAIFFSRALAFHTGSTGAWRPAPNQVLLSEVKQLQGIRHPAFIKVSSVGECEGRAFAVLELIDGTTWRTGLGKPNGPKLEHFVQLVTALAETHASGELPWHGDLKPDNLYLTSSGGVRIGDPCSAMTQRLASGEVSSMLATELYNPLFDTDDLFALGVLLVEVLSGINCLFEAMERPPSTTGRALGPELQKLLRAVRATGRGSQLIQRLDQMPLPTELSKAISPQLEAIALKCMGLMRVGDSIECSERFESVAALKTALASLG